MQSRSIVYHGRWLFSLVILVLGISVSSPAQSKKQKPEACVLQFNTATTDYQSLLGGPPQTAGMEAGVIVLAPSKSVGKHSTKNFEEMLVILSGTGKLKITGGTSLVLKKNVVTYCPPNTEHDVVNTGKTPLRYIYIAAKLGK